MPDPLHEHHDHLAERYEELVESDQEPSDMIVAISGQRAAGTSTHAEDLAIEFGIEHVDNGTMQREAADDHGYDDVERFREEHPDADLEVDAAKLDRAFSGEPLIAEGRLDAAALYADRGDGEPVAPVRIKLICDDDVRAERYAQRAYDADEPDDGLLEQAREEMLDGDEEVYNIFDQVYDGIDPRDDEFYTHVIDNTRDYDEVHDEIVEILEDHGFERRQVYTKDEWQELGT